MADNEKTTEQLHRIIQLLQQGNAKLDKIVELLTPAPDTDIKNLGGSISTPTKK